MPSIDAAELNATGTYCLEPWNTLYVSVKPCCNAPSTTHLREKLMAQETADRVWHGRAAMNRRAAI